MALMTACVLKRFERHRTAAVGRATICMRCGKLGQGNSEVASVLNFLVVLLV